MQVTNIHNAKTNLSKYLKLVASGEEVIICSYGNPIAKIVPYSKNYKIRKPGIWKGKIKMSEDFDKLPSNFLRYFK